MKGGRTRGTVSIELGLSLLSLCRVPRMLMGTAFRMIAGSGCSKDLFIPSHSPQPFHRALPGTVHFL